MLPQRSLNYIDRVQPRLPFSAISLDQQLPQEWAVSVAVVVCDGDVDFFRLIANKPRGLQAARKLRNDRRENRWVGNHRIIRFFRSLTRGHRRTRPTKNGHSETSTRRRPLVDHRTPRESCSRRSVLRPSSPTLPSGNVSGCSSLRTARRSLLSCP